MPKNIRQDLLFIFWTSVCVFLFFSLLSFSPYDPSFNSIGQEFAKIKNFCGLLGSFLSDTLYQFFGLGAWLVLFVVLRCAWRSFSREPLLKGNVLFIFFILNVCSLMSLYGSQIYLFEKQISLGGVAGAFVVTHLMPLLSFYGLSIMLWAIFIGLMTFYTRLSASQWFYGIKIINSFKEALKTCFKVLIFFWFLFCEKIFTIFKALFNKLRSLRRSQKAMDKQGKILEVDFSQNHKDSSKEEPQEQDGELKELRQSEPGEKSAFWTSL